MKRMFSALIVSAVIALGVFILYTVWPAGTAADHFVLGKAYYEKEKYPEAIIEFMNALQRDGHHRDAHYFLAQSYMVQKNLGAAARQLNALLEYYPEDRDASLQLGNIYLMVGHGNPAYAQAASEIAEKILMKEPKDVPALTLLGNALAGLQDYHGSLEKFEEALKFDPQNAAIYVSMGSAQVLQKDLTQAEQTFLKARALDPKDRNALISLANYYVSTGKTDDAAAIFTEATSLYPTDREIYVQAVMFYNHAGRFELTETVLRHAQEKTPDDPEASLLLAALYTAKGRNTDARELLLHLKRQFPDNFEVALHLAQNFLIDEPVRARTEVDRILKADPRNPIGNILLGELQYFDGKYGDANATFSQDFVINSKFPASHLFLGRMAYANGQLDLAQEHYQKAVALNANYAPARLELAQVFLNKNKIGDARVETERALAIQPRSLPGRLLKATVDILDKNYAVAEAELTSLSKEQPGNPAVHERLAFYYSARGLNANVEKSLARVLELQPNSQEHLQKLVMFYVSQKQTERAIQVIHSRVPDSLKTAFHYELMGKVYSSAARLQEAEEAYKKSLQKEPDRVSANEQLAVQYIQSGRLDEANRKLDEVLKKSSSNAAVYTMKGSIAENLGNLTAAKDNYRKALIINPNVVTAANNLAYLLGEEGVELEVALSWAQVARRGEPDNPSTADTLGWIQYKLKRNTLAREQLQFAVSKDPGNPVFQYHLAMIYKETNQPREAEAALKRALKSTNKFKERTQAEAALKDMASLK